MKSDVNAILIAIKGRTDMLKQLFGASEPKNAKLTPEKFRAMTQSHNDNIRRKDG